MTHRPLQVRALARIAVEADVLSARFSFMRIRMRKRIHSIRKCIIAQNWAEETARNILKLK